MGNKHLIMIRINGVIINENIAFEKYASNGIPPTHLKCYKNLILRKI